MALTLDELQRRVATTAVYPGKDACSAYPLLGLSGEVGEVFVPAAQLLARAARESEEDGIPLGPMAFNLAILAGQVAEIVKKAYRDADGGVSDDAAIALMVAARQFMAKGAALETACQAHAHGQATLVAGTLMLRPEEDADVCEAMRKELGDVIWYVCQSCTALGLSVDEVAGGMLAKLADRAARCVLHGSGDDR